MKDLIIVAKLESYICKHGKYGSNLKPEDDLFNIFNV